MCKLTFAFFLIALFCAQLSQLGAATPDLTILYVMDGICADGIDRSSLENLGKFKKEGCYYRTIHLPLPVQPQQSKDYPYTCSLPNIVLASGTTLIRPDMEMIQHSFARNKKKTAFVANTNAYFSVGKDFDIYDVIKQDPPSDDVPVVKKAMEIIKDENPTFIRLHLQAVGRGGWMCTLDENKDQAWYKNIWHENSPYIKRMRTADKLLGELVEWLKTTGRMEKTTIYVVGDHGQADQGMHPPHAKGSATTCMLIFGYEINKNKVFDHADITDIVKTITHLHEIDAPNYCSGRVLMEAVAGSKKEDAPSDRSLIERLNKSLIMQKQLYDGTGKDFMKIEECPEWYKDFTDLKSLVEHSEKLTKSPGNK